MALGSGSNIVPTDYTKLGREGPSLDMMSEAAGILQGSRKSWVMPPPPMISIF